MIYIMWEILICPKCNYCIFIYYNVLFYLIFKGFLQAYSEVVLIDDLINDSVLNI